MKPLLYPLSSPAHGRTAGEALVKRFAVENDPLEETNLWLDTFDWRLDRAGLGLYSTVSPAGAALVLEDAQGTRRRLRLSGSRPQLFEFADQIPSGPLRAPLEKIVPPRRLLPLVRIRLLGDTLRIVDKNGKSRVVVRVERWSVYPPYGARAKRRQVLRVQPVRGYDRELQRVRKLLAKRGFEPTRSSELDLGLELIGRRRRDYSAKLELQIEPSERTDVALRRIHLFLLGVIRANEEGARADLDPEFLHDLRVAVRRSRALLTQLRGIYPKRVVERTKTGLRWIQAITGPTRDLHVYVLNLPTYRSEVPEELRAGLDPWCDLLYERLAREQAEMARELGTGRYRRLLAGWERFLTSAPPAASTLEHARRPCGEVVRERIEKRYKRIRKLGQSVDRETPDAVLHALRIECKKLRYLLEAFRSVLGDEARRAIGALRKLQDALGDFNDCVVQTAALREFEAELVETGRANALTVDALESLVGRIQERKEATRRRFEKRFAKFTGRKRALSVGP